jgi:hypothetical protein
MQPTAPALSAILIAGPLRARAQRVLNALGAQSRADFMEIVVLDLAADRAARLAVPSNVPTVYLERPPTTLWVRARMDGLRHASAPIAAFIEDHCVPAVGWAAALIEAHRDRWAAVGYAFTSGNPQTYLGRSGIVAEYGPWVHPVRPGRSGGLAGNNISYKREILLALTQELDLAHALDFNIHAALHARGHSLATAPDALVAHENFTDLRDAAQANFSYARLLGANRAALGSWGRLRRLLVGLATPWGIPPLRIVRLLKDTRGQRERVGPTVAALPLVMYVYACSALGEAAGYLFGCGEAERHLTYWELMADRAPRHPRRLGRSRSSSLPTAGA